MNTNTSARLVGFVINAAIAALFGAAALGYACLISGVIGLVISAAVEVQQ